MKGLLFRPGRIIPLLVAVAVFQASARAETSPEPQSLTLELAQAVVDDIIPRVEKLRGLEFQRPVPVEVIDDAAARKHMIQRLESFEQDQQIVWLTRVYALLGLAAEGDDLLELLLAAMEGQAGGFYDPAKGAYYLLDDMPATAAGIFTAHELTHALEDQHFDLDERILAAIDNEDWLFARSAVHEGSATLLMGTYITEAMLAGELNLDALQSLAAVEEAQRESLDDLPPVLWRQLLGPYVLGAYFLGRGNALALAGGYPAADVDRAYDDSPRSSEQILHPEKYWDREQRDDPVPVAPFGVGLVLGRRWTERSHGVLGELTVALLVGAENPGVLEMLDGSKWTNPAASGWGGDRWELWGRRDETVLVVLTVWDSEDEAREFAEALPAEHRFDWLRVGDRVAIVGGDTGKKTRKLLTRLLESAG